MKVYFYSIGIYKNITLGIIFYKFISFSAQGDRCYILATWSLRRSIEYNIYLIFYLERKFLWGKLYLLQKSLQLLWNL